MVTSKISQQILENIFEYDNYRVFLDDYFKAKKVENTSFSQRYFAKKAGFNAHNFCTLVVQGKRNLSTESIQKIIKTIGLKAKAATYFEYLVYLNQANTIEDKEIYFQRLKAIGNRTQFYQLNREQFFFYEKWYYPVIRELLAMHDWKGDFAALSKAIRPSISVHEVKEAVEMLEHSGMVHKDANGRYYLTNKLVTSARVPDFIKKKARRDVLLRGIETIDTIAPSEKYAAYSTITMSKKLYEEVRSILDETRQRILSLVNDDENAEEVYELVFQVFPVSNMNRLKKKVPGDGINEN